MASVFDRTGVSTLVELTINTLSSSYGRVDLQFAQDAIDGLLRLSATSPTLFPVGTRERLQDLRMVGAHDPGAACRGLHKWREDLYAFWDQALADEVAEPFT